MCWYPKDYEYILAVMIMSFVFDVFKKAFYLADSL